MKRRNKEEGVRESAAQSDQINQNHPHSVKINSSVGRKRDVCTYGKRMIIVSATAAMKKNQTSPASKMFLGMLCFVLLILNQVRQK